MSLPAELLKKIKHLQLKMDHVATDLLAGLYRSVFKGKGMEFEEVREYQYGDDIRTIDWNVSARMNRPFIKKFREEREITLMLIVDNSASMLFGSQELLKSTIIAELGAVLAFSAIKNQDKVGLLLFSEGIDLYLPPKKGTRHVLRMIRELLAFPSKGKKTALKEVLAYFGKVQKKRTICFILSDFLCPPFYKALAPLAQKHEWIAICVRDPLESSFPPSGLVTLSNLESGHTTKIDTSSLKVRTQWREVAEKELNAVAQQVKSLGVGWIEVDCSSSYLEPLLKYFKTKRRLH